MALRHFHRRYFQSLGNLGYKHLSTKVIPELDEAVKEGIESKTLKPRKHPGVLKLTTCSLPDHIVQAMRVIIEEHPIKTILNDAKMLANYLFSRHYPWEDEDLRERERDFTDDVKSRLGELDTAASEEQVQHYNNIVKYSVAKLMGKYNYRWSPLDLHDYSCLVYLFTRAAPNYAATVKVFNEITKLCPHYSPTSLFDFGSGVGSVHWAATSCWGDSLKEFVNIDSSSSMLTLHERLLCGGREEHDPPAGVFYRSFLPAQHMRYSLVVSAHSLLELPSRQTRLNLLVNLWRKTKDFLVIIEQGTKPGFKVVVEARDFILSLSDDKSTGHIFAPCRHDDPCPRFLRGPYPCHFQIQYFEPPIIKKQSVKKELLSYVIIKKGPREDSNDWPRVVRPVLKRHRHVICRLCTAQGELQEVILSKRKHGKEMYGCARKTNWGDLLPVKLSTITSDDSQEFEEDNISKQQSPD